MRDRRFLKQIHWKYIIVDEGHRLKNMDCRLIRELKSFSSNNRLLLTGTPLQNNLAELWSLLNFLLPDIFDDLSFFSSWFEFAQHIDSDKVIQQERENAVVSKLHAILRPFVLRRLKSEVEHDLPPRIEIPLYVPLASVQQNLYKEIVTGQFTGKAQSLQNTLMQLRKCCNHPYLFDGFEEVDSKVCQALQ